MVKPDMSQAIEVGGAEYMKILASPGHGLPVTYPPGSEMALANDANELGTDWVPTKETFDCTLDGKSFTSTRVLIRIDGVVRFWHKVAVTHPGLGSVTMMTFPSKIWEKVGESYPANYDLFGSEFVYGFGPSGGYGSSGDMLSRVIPGMKERANCPHCGIEYPSSLDDMIIHLNDFHRWTRERIADWLDTLDIDLTFPVPETIPSNIH